MDSTAAILERKFQEVANTKAQLEKSLVQLQERVRAKPGNVDLLAQLNKAKAEIGRTCDEHAELARAISRMRGGKNYTVA